MRPWIAVLLVACGPGAAGDRTADDQDGAPRAHGGGLEASGTVGGLDQAAVEVEVSAATAAVNRCVNDGRKELHVLGGDVDLQITVGQTGKAESIVMRSTLGDHRVEACIVKAFRARTWPRPVGGDVGLIGQKFDFTPGGEPPDSWSPSKLESAMQKEAEGNENPYADLMKSLEACRKSAGTGRLTVTTYLDEDGLSQAVGVGMEDARGTGAVDCIATAVQTTSFPAPGDNFVKITLTVGP